jgi:hypothetical protein
MKELSLEQLCVLLNRPLPQDEEVEFTGQVSFDNDTSGISFARTGTFNLRSLVLTSQGYRYKITENPPSEEALTITFFLRTDSPATLSFPSEGAQQLTVHLSKEKSRLYIDNATSIKY